ncbi:hypothetical protein TBLA_0C02650 [Henningerozyma blattae CBS 6284]|uniref:Uncharacterized protein n=1 Tax=Henningerozyma blattae (strain ATCC 34711 / CBS 6284 / DSM 70876 / NBRC 10599 / NRRL Y-10934 / UCD 77-7) TaxID=1071380 RepID=I2H122_HENB6|nr:hypothetical protein TBLA_0C02650 [Tetrapisispora blattae CBS 6284]CCH60074.1 hypothetical protein TBLA_0C02650 [Tetrapisispora blattae CBS 6284]
MGICQEEDLESSNVEQFNKKFLENKSTSFLINNHHEYENHPINYINNNGMLLPQTFFDSPSSIFDNLLPFSNNPSSFLTGSRKLPTDSQFEKCKKLSGLSVWDTSGIWNCLFPKNTPSDEINPPYTNPFKSNTSNNNEGNSINKSRFSTHWEPKLLSAPNKEEVLADKKHDLGLFFSNYNVYLSWKLHMKSLEKDLLETKRKELIKQQNKQINFPNTPEDIQIFGSSSATGNDNKNKNIIGTSQSISMNSTNEGKQKISLYKTYFDDGTVSVKTETETTPWNTKKTTKNTKEETILVEDDNS